jgi:hypothetical protein
MIALLGWVVGCGSPPTEVARRSSELIYGNDDRIELFEAEPFIQNLGRSVIALGLRSEIVEAEPGALAVLSPPWLERAGLCEDERFAQQPSFAVCSGIAVATDLVLTAAHCTRTAALNDLAVVTGYAYQPSGDLALTENGRMHAVEAVLASDSFWDYAWLQVEPGLLAMPSNHLSAADVVEGTRLLSINHGAGLPAKVDTGGVAYPISAEELVTTLDSLGGGSGGPVFANGGDLVGLLVGGGPDYAATGSGCVTVATSPDLADAANELVVSLRVPLNVLCVTAPAYAAALPSCNESTIALERRKPAQAGCSLAHPAAHASAGFWSYRHRGLSSSRCTRCA